MGLIKAIGGAIRGEMADQWKEYFYCDALESDVLVTKGQKRTSSRFGSRNNGNENLITNGSVVAVNEGQCMIIVDQGKVVEFCAEAGEFLYDTSTEPSLLYGDLGENIKKTFAAVGRRFTFGGDTGKDQRVYFFNTKEIMGNKYGTATPVPFVLWIPILDWMWTSPSVVMENILTRSLTLCSFIRMYAVTWWMNTVVTPLTAS